jgi:4-hydroxy-3-methylbut-2-enyl diphosphate reductase
MSSLLVLTPLRVEQLALGPVPGGRVLRTGMGPARARIAAARAQADDAACVAVAGLCAGVSAGLRAGDVVCATELVGEDGARIDVPGSTTLAAALERRGLRVHVGPLYSAAHILGPEARRTLPRQILGVDMESVWLASGATRRPFGVVRVVVDEAGRRLADPRIAIAGPRALWSLRRVAGGLAAWATEAAVPAGPEPAAATMPHAPFDPLPATSRGAGVERS